MTLELIPKHDNRKSFYNKAIVEQENGVLKLYSYNTLVCVIDNGKPKVIMTYSNTTLRHIKEFLKQNGFKADTKSQIIKDYMQNG